MARKKFIRHLEYYGFPDQNGYSSEINGVDLSDIREKNKEQDEEIKDLGDDKADKKDLVKLSGTVEDLIETQGEINQELVNAISGITKDIDELKEIDNQYGEQLSSITDSVNDIIKDINDIDEKVDVIEYNITTISSITENIINILDDDYVKKGDVYTKEETYSKDELDSIISSGFSGYATQEWVEEQGYLTEESGDSRYGKIEDLEELAEMFTSAATNISEIFDEIDKLSGDTNDRIDGINDKIDSLSGKVYDELSELGDKVVDIANDIDDINEKVNSNTEDIEELENAVSSNTEDISEIKNNIDTLSGGVTTLQNEIGVISSTIEDMQNEIDTKASKRALDETRIELQGEINELKTNKADKTSLDFVSGAVDSVSELLTAEITRSTTADRILDGKVDNLEIDVNNAVTIVNSYETRVTNLESGLEQEIIDRKKGDNDVKDELIGTSGDSRDADTIWGAKNHANEMKRQAIVSAEVYTDNAITVFDTELDNLRSWAEKNFSSAATKQYVSDMCNDTETEIRSEFNTLLNNEIQRAERAELNLDTQMQVLSSEILANTLEITHNATRINAITRWDGENPEEYEYWASAHTEANGILDVLHREFHEYVEKDGIIESIEYDGENLIIKYKTTEGEKTTIIPVGTLVDLTNYYTKDETNAVVGIETVRATAAEEALDNKIDDAINNLTVDCGIY